MPNPPESTRAISFENHGNVSNQPGIQYVYGNINYYHPSSQAVRPITKVPSPAVLEEPSGHSGSADNFGGDSALIELWPAIPDGEIAKIETNTDIIAIHGIHGHPIETWTEGSRLWPRDFLPSAIPKARIFTFGYNCALTFEGTASRIHSHAVQLLEAIKARRSLDTGPTRKMFFICHCLGGLLFKKVFLIAQEEPLRYASIGPSIAGVIFMGTPHVIGKVTHWANIFNNIYGVQSDSASAELSENQRLKFEMLGDICFQFSIRAEMLQVFTFFETLKTDVIGDLAVGADSTILHLPNETCIPVQADHSSICKFSSASSQTYLLVLGSIIELIDNVEVSRSKHALRSFQYEFLESLPEAKPELMFQKIPARQGDSCRWMDTNQTFLTWKDNPSYRLLRIHGPPGSGKTVMAKYIIGHLRSLNESGLQQKAPFIGPGIDQCLAFFFCDDKDTCRKTSQSFLRSILYQILHRPSNFHLFRYVDEVVKYPGLEHIKGPSLPDLETLWECLFQITHKSRGATFWIIIDALDELERTAREEILQGIDSVIKGDLVGRVKILITGRDVPKHKSFLSALLKPMEINMDNLEVHNDVQNFIGARTDTLFRESDIISKRLRDKVDEELVRVSSGTFLHASLALANFSTGVKSWTSEIVRERLASLQNQSSDLESFYCGLLRRIPSRFRGQSRQIFMWTLACCEPLTLEQLHCAVTLREDHQSFSELQEDMSHNFADNFYEYCGYLLKVDNDGFVRFTHQSVKDLLLGKTCLPANEDIINFYRAQLDSVHYTLASKCLRMLQLRDFSRVTVHRKIYPKNQLPQNFLDEGRNGMKELLKQYLILEYSMKFWARHSAQVAHDTRIVRMVSDFIVTYNAEYFRLCSMPWMKSACQIFPWIEIPDVQPVEPPLHHLLQQGDFPEVIQILIDSGHDINELDTVGMSPLHWATVRNRTKSFGLLMQNTNLDPNRGNPGSDKPIHQSIYWHRPELLQRLLDDRRIEINIRGRKGQTALHTALEFPSSGAADTILSFKSDSIDFGTLDSEGLTPLEQAFRSSQAEAVVTKMVRLVDLKIARKHSTNWKSNLLMLADIRGWTEIEDALIKVDNSQVLSLDDEGMNTLTRYAYYGRKSKVAMLLGKMPASAITSSTPWGRYNLLHLCAQQDWEDVVHVLHSKFGLEGLGYDHSGRTLLHWAVEFGWAHCSRYCTGKASALINRQDRDGSTALHLAVLTRNTNALQMLLDQGADYLLKDKHGKNPVHIAAECGYRAAVELFLATETREFGTDRQRIALLHFMAMWLPGSLVKYFIDGKRPLLNVRDRLRRTPLHYAATFNNLSAAAILLAEGASVGVKDQNLQTPLHYAAREGNLDVLKLLIEHEANPRETDGFTQTCLQISIRSGDIPTIEFMLQIAPLIHGRDRFGLTALHRACALEDPQTLCGLIALGADYNAKDNLNHTPLHVAVARQNRSATSLLLQCSGLKLSEKDHLGCTPLDRALVEADSVISSLLITHHAERTENYRSKLKACIPYQGIFHTYAWHDWPVCLTPHERRLRNIYGDSLKFDFEGEGERREEREKREEEREIGKWDKGKSEREEWDKRERKMEEWETERKAWEETTKKEWEKRGGERWESEWKKREWDEMKKEEWERDRKEWTKRVKEMEEWEEWERDRKMLVQIQREMERNDLEGEKGDSIRREREEREMERDKRGKEREKLVREVWEKWEKREKMEREKMERGKTEREREREREREGEEAEEIETKERKGEQKENRQLVVNEGNQKSAWWRRKRKR